MRYLFTLALLVVLITPCRAEEAPALFVERFYSTCLKERPSGLPSDAQTNALSSYFSPELNKLFVRARMDRSEYMRRYPDDKPPLIEGDLFSSLYEGPTGFEVGSVERAGEEFRVLVRFSHVHPGNPEDVFRWQDAVRIRRWGHSFVIVDIEFLGEWPFKGGNRLSEVLRSAKGRTP